MDDQPKLSELIRFAQVDAGSSVIDICLGAGDSYIGKQVT